MLRAWHISIKKLNYIFLTQLAVMHMSTRFIYFRMMDVGWRTLFVGSRAYGNATWYNYNPISTLIAWWFFGVSKRLLKKYSENQWEHRITIILDHQNAIHNGDQLILQLESITIPFDLLDLSGAYQYKTRCCLPANIRCIATVLVHKETENTVLFSVLMMNWFWLLFI